MSKALIALITCIGEYLQQASAGATFSSLYLQSFSGDGPPLVTNLTREDSTSALAMMEFARLEAYSQCGDIPYMQGLNGTLVELAFEVSGFGSDSLAAGEQSQVGKILAYAAASAQPDTLEGDLVSVFDVVFGYYAMNGRISCSPIAVSSSPGEMNLLFAAAAQEGQLPTSREDIEAWISLIRNLSGLATIPSSDISPSAAVVYQIVTNRRISFFPGSFPTLIALITGTNNASNPITNQVFQIISSPAWPNPVTQSAASRLLDTIVDYPGNNFSYCLNWIVRHLSGITEHGASIMAAVISAANQQQIITALSVAFPNLSLDKIRNIEYTLNKIGGNLISSDPDIVKNAKAGLFWLFANSISPLSI